MPEALTKYDPDEWRKDAACRDLDTAVFFPETEDETATAKAVCATCPVREACLQFALVTRQDDGVWGGLDENERRRLRRRRQEAARKAAA
jgi:WhiB family redox-sensing transcriptional regulator